MRPLIKKILSFDFATDEKFCILVGSQAEMYTTTKEVKLSIVSGRGGCCWSFCSNGLY